MAKDEDQNAKDEDTFLESNHAELNHWARSARFMSFLQKECELGKSVFSNLILEAKGNRWKARNPLYSNFGERISEYNDLHMVALSISFKSKYLFHELVINDNITKNFRSLIYNLYHEEINGLKKGNNIKIGDEDDFDRNCIPKKEFQKLMELKRRNEPILTLPNEEALRSLDALRKSLANI